MGYQQNAKIYTAMKFFQNICGLLKLEKKSTFNMVIVFCFKAKF